jgi:AP-1 complex subunit beta-1
MQTYSLQVFILDSLAKYQADTAKDAESIIERVLPRLQHANCAVVLSAVKVSTPRLCNHRSPTYP